MEKKHERERRKNCWHSKTYCKDRWRNEEKRGTKGRHRRDGQKKREVARRRWWMMGASCINRNKDKGQWRQSKDREKRGQGDGRRAKITLCSLIPGRRSCASGTSANWESVPVTLTRSCRQWLETSVQGAGLTGDARLEPERPEILR